MEKVAPRTVDTKKTSLFVRKLVALLLASQSAASKLLEKSGSFLATEEEGETRDVLIIQETASQTSLENRAKHEILFLIGRAKSVSEFMETPEELIGKRVILLGYPLREATGNGVGDYEICARCQIKRAKTKNGSVRLRCGETSGPRRWLWSDEKIVFLDETSPLWRCDSKLIIGKKIPETNPSVNAQ
ncbi:MAG: hypothetical protein ABIH35_02970 [Patescibacteria group bacterium]